MEHFTPNQENVETTATELEQRPRKAPEPMLWNDVFQAHSMNVNKQEYKLIENK